MFKFTNKIFYLFIITFILSLFCFTAGCINSELKPTPTPCTVDYFYNEGLSLSNQKKYSEAIEFFDKALSLEPENILVLTQKGNALCNQGKYDEAIQCYDKILKITPEDIKILCIKGKALTFQKKYDEAIQCYKKALNITPDNKDIADIIKELKYKKSVASYFQKGDELYNSGKYEDAIIRYNLVLKQNSNDKDALYSKGNCSICLGKYREAIECYNKILSADSKDTNALCGKGNALRGLGEYDKAVQCYNEVLTIEPDNKYAQDCKRAEELYVEYCHGGDYYSTPRFKKKVQQDYSRTGAPENITVIDWKAGFEYSFSSASFEYKRAIDLFPNRVRAWKGLAWVELKDEEYEKALQAVNTAMQCIDAEPEMTKLLILKGFILKEQGDYLRIYDKYKSAMDKYLEAIHSFELAESKGFEGDYYEERADLDYMSYKNYDPQRVDIKKILIEKEKLEKCYHFEKIKEETLEKYYKMYNMVNG